MRGNERATFSNTSQYDFSHAPRLFTLSFLLANLNNDNKNNTTATTQDQFYYFFLKQIFTLVIKKNWELAKGFDERIGYQFKMTDYWQYSSKSKKRKKLTKREEEKR